MLPVAALVFSLAAAAPPAPVVQVAPADGSRYYFVLLGGQSIPFRLRTGHKWAVFVRATPIVGGRVQLETVTISWLPEAMPVRPFMLRPTIGKNYSLEETLAMAAKDSVRYSLWGPFEIDADRYRLAAEQAALLESGAVRYRAIDSFNHRRDVQHCVHAFCYADPVMQYYIQPLVRIGEPGTSHLVMRYATHGAFRSTETHDWLLPALGLDRPGVVHRSLGEYVPRQFR